MKKIKKSILINASKEAVWQVLTDDQYNRIWYEEFAAGTTADTDWQLGSVVKFTDAAKNGLLGKVVTNKPYEFLSVEYTGLIMDGKEDHESENAKEVVGALETYMLSENGTSMHLSIASDMGEDYFDSMSMAWDSALLKVKTLAESLKK